MLRPWILPALTVLLGSLAVAPWFVRGDVGRGLLLEVLFLLLAGVTSPLLFPRPVTAAEARRRSASDGRPVVYWRPGCRYCIRLRLRLGRRARAAHWVDIWRDPAGAADVRAVNDGDETVPTVFLSGRPHVNPDPAWLRRQLSSGAAG